MVYRYYRYTHYFRWFIMENPIILGNGRSARATPVHAVPTREEAGPGKRSQWWQWLHDMAMFTHHIQIQLGGSLTVLRSLHTKHGEENLFYNEIHGKTMQNQHHRHRNEGTQSHSCATWSIFAMPHMVKTCQNRQTPGG